MADVFVSYSKATPEPTRDLARDLEARGFTVWWDTDLLPGEKFHETIIGEITNAKVVVVIWSPASIVSNWVMAEAALASKQNKLLTVCTPDTDVSKVPLPFNMLHIERISERDRIMAAFAARGLLPRDEAKAKIAQRAEELYEQAMEYHDGRGRPVDIPEATKLLQEAIQLGHVPAKNVLAGIYINKQHGLKQRPAEALRLLYEARAAGDLLASISLGLIHLKGLEGLGIPKDTEEGERFLQEAAEGNSPSALWFLAQQYHLGTEGISRNLPLAIKYYERGAALGNPICIYKLGVIYGDGDGVLQDWQRSLSYFRKASDLGWMPATVQLAVLMIEGEHIDKDVAEGLAILEREVRMADGPYRAHVLYHLGRVNVDGVGVERNVRKGLDLLHQAAELDNAEAVTKLGILYDEGKIVPRDESKALTLLQRGVDMGYREAMVRLGAMYVRRGNFDEGLRLLHDAEKLGSGLAAAGLAVCYQHGRGVARDLAEARRWFNVAGSRGMDVTEALRSLGEFPQTPGPDT